jgi:hypothetical protein
MNKMVLTLALSMMVAGSAQAGFLDKVTDAAGAITSAKESGLNSEQAVLEVVKSKVKTGSTTKEEVKTKLGAPKATNTVDGNEVWKYDIGSLGKDAADAVTIANALGKDTSKTQKIVELKFKGDVLDSYDVVSGTLSN